VKRMWDPYYQGAAAELAFCFLLSMVPIFILLGWILKFFSLSVGILREILLDYVPAELANGLADYLHYTPAPASLPLNLIFLVVALWAASRGIYSLIRISNYAYTGSGTGQGFLRERLRAMWSVLLLVFILVPCLLILAYGDLISQALFGLIEPAGNFAGLLWNMFRWPLGLLIYFLVLNSIYYILPTKKLAFKKYIPGSLVASAGMLVGTWIYSFFAYRVGNYDFLYGSLASVAGLLFWFLFLGYVLILGIVLNSAYLDLTCRRSLQR